MLDIIFHIIPGSGLIWVGPTRVTAAPEVPGYDKHILGNGWTGPVVSFPSDQVTSTTSDKAFFFLLLFFFSSFFFFFLWRDLQATNATLQNTPRRRAQGRLIRRTELPEGKANYSHKIPLW